MLLEILAFLLAILNRGVVRILNLLVDLLSLVTRLVVDLRLASRHYSNDYITSRLVYLRALPPLHINIHSLKCIKSGSVEHYGLPEGQGCLEDGLVEFVERRVDGELALIGERVEGARKGRADSDVA